MMALTVMLMIGMGNIVPVQAEELVVSINGTALQDGKYYEFGGSQHGNDGTMIELDAAPTSGSYIYYAAGEMEVHGTVGIYPGSTYRTTILQIEHGTLTLKGDGTLKIGNHQNTDTLITGTADAALKTEAYTGEITLSAWGGQAVTKGLALVELRTTEAVTIYCEHMNTETAVSAGSVILEGDYLNFDLREIYGVEVVHVIEATDTENGEIRLISSNNKIKDNRLDLANGANINATGALLKAKNSFLSSNGGNYNSAQGITLVGKTVAEGNLTISAKNSVLLRAQDTVADGNLKVTIPHGSSGGQSVEVYAENGAVTTGNMEIEAPGAGAIVSSSGDAPAIGGDARVNARSISMNSDYQEVVRGNADLQAVRRIDLNGAKGYPVIGGSSITLNVPEGDIQISRKGNGGADEIPMLNGTVQTGNGVILYNDGGTKWVQEMATGQNYYADQCQHPIVNGDNGSCMVCKQPEVVYAEVIGADGTVRQELAKTFGGSGPYNVIYSLQDGDTVRFTKDLYGTGNVVDIPDGRKLTFDLNGHTLAVKNIMTMGDLTIANGTYKGDVQSAGVGLTKTLTFRNAETTLKNLSWMAANGVVLEGSRVTIVGNNGSEQCWLEMLRMDGNSVMTLQNVGDGIGNYGRYDLEESLGAIRGFFPDGYSIERRKKNPTDTNERNTIVDSNGEIAKSIVLRYRQMTDADINIVLEQTSYVYDGQKKTPGVAVTYGGQVLEVDKNYTVSYADNTNAGTASVTVVGMGAYHGSKVLNFNIDKAAQTAPAGVSTVNVSISGAKDGVIQNLATTMEYSTDQVNWQAVNGESLTGMGAGEYYIRYKETENYYASPATKVTVGATAGSDGAGGAPVTEDTTASTGRRTVKTGDDTPVEMLAILMVSSVAMAAAIGLRRKESKR